jgi:oligopeptide transport system ATP-binding protein
MSEEILRATSLKKSFPGKRNAFGRVTDWTDAVKDVSLAVHRGETYGLLGESGAGKSTVGRLLLRLIEPDAGEIVINDQDVMALSNQDLRKLRSKARMIFQDPFVSLDPSMVVGDAVAEPLIVHEELTRDEREERVLDLFERVGLGREHLDRYPSEFSGGQLQRVAVARAIATNPDLIVADEPVAALDMSIRAQVINLLRDLQQASGIAMIFISHDLSLVRLIADRVGVMYRGQIVESGVAESVFQNPQHPYTRSLLSAIPVPDPARRHEVRTASGLEVSDEQRDLTGCDYADRCPHATELCWNEAPPERRNEISVATCHYAIEDLRDPTVVG